MNKDEYLINLKSDLSAKLSKNEVLEILNDYEEYFETGLSEGKTEKELIDEFGSPGTILNELLREKGEQGLICKSFYRRWLSSKHITQVCLFILFGGLLYYRFRMRFYLFGNNSVNDIYLLIACPILLALCGVYRLLKFPTKFDLYLRRLNLWLALLFLVIVTLLLVLLFMHMKNIEIYLTQHMTYSIHQILLYFKLLMYALYFSFTIEVLLLLRLINTYRAVNGLLFYPFGVLFSLLDFEALLGGMGSDFSRLDSDIMRCLHPFEVGIFLSVVVAAGIALTQRIYKRKA